MKRYIRCTTENHTVFDETSTHTSYYDNFLNEKDRKYMQDAKNRDGEIVMMTPDEYYEEASKLFRRNGGRNTDVFSLIRQRSNKFTDQYVEDMRNGDKFPLCYLNYAENSQEGLHRMLAAKRAFGADVKYPVLVVTIHDMDRYNLWKTIQESSEFDRYDFGDMIDEMVDDLSDWHAPVPNDIKEKAKEYLISKAKDAGHNIELGCEIEDEDGHPRLAIFLTQYDGYELQTTTVNKHSPWLEDMFDLNDGESEDEIDDILLDLGEEDLLDEEDEELSFDDFLKKHGLKLR